LQVGNGVKKGVERIFDSLPDSNYACLVLDKKTHNLHFFRTPDRPLRVWRSGNLILIGSTEEILENAFKHTIGVSSNRVKTFKKWTPRSGYLYTIKPDLDMPDPVKIADFPMSRYATETRDPYSLSNPQSVRRFPYVSGVGLPRVEKDFLDPDVRERAESWGMVTYGD